MRVYHFVNRQFGLQDIEQRRLKVAQIEDLNDPFELRVFSSNDPKVRVSFEVMRREIAQKRGVLCFSKGWKNPVQWSHYAEKHRGLAMGFEVPDNLLTPIVYSSKRVEPDIAILLSKTQDAEDLMRKTFTTKYAHWRYEREVRVHVELNDRDPLTNLFFASFSDGLDLKEVIVGAYSTISRSEVRAALGADADRVNTFKARLAFKSFRVVRQRNEKLWT